VKINVCTKLEIILQNLCNAWPKMSINVSKWTMICILLLIKSLNDHTEAGEVVWKKLLKQIYIYALYVIDKSKVNENKITTRPRYKYKYTTDLNLADRMQLPSKKGLSWNKLVTSGHR
jgi:hypothetical protein